MPIKKGGMITKKIKLSKSIVGSAEKKALSAVIDRSYLGMGKYVQEFENNLKKYLGSKNVICVNSGTAALHLAVMSLGLKASDEILVQSLTFVASFQAISAVGAKPIACEVDAQSCTIDLKDAERKITKNTKAIMPVHYAGNMGDLRGIYKFAKKHNLRVIEDAAHAFGTVYQGKKIGSFGDIICFSFDGIKNITCGEGGAVVTSDDKAVRFIMDARLLGVEKDTEKRYKGQRSWEFDVTHQGYRYHMSNLFAAVGIEQLKKFERSFKPLRQKLAKQYYAGLSSVRGIGLFPIDYTKVVPHIFVIRVLKGKRDYLRKCLIENNIECGIHYFPNHLLSYYGRKKGDLPITEKLYSEILSLPLHPGLSNEDQDYVIKTIRAKLNHVNL